MQKQNLLEFLFIWNSSTCTENDDDNFVCLFFERYRLSLFKIYLPYKRLTLAFQLAHIGLSHPMAMASIRKICFLTYWSQRRKIMSEIGFHGVDPYRFVCLCWIKFRYGHGELILSSYSFLYFHQFIELNLRLCSNLIPFFLKFFKTINKLLTENSTKILSIFDPSWP